jgi:hypothetical protein
MVEPEENVSKRLSNRHQQEKTGKGFGIVLNATMVPTVFGKYPARDVHMLNAVYEVLGA